MDNDIFYVLARRNPETDKYEYLQITDGAVYWTSSFSDAYQSFERSFSDAREDFADLLSDWHYRGAAGSLSKENLFFLRVGYTILNEDDYRKRN